MNRFLYVSLIALLTILGFTMYIHRDLGSLSFQFADFELQTNLLVAVSALLCFLFVIVSIIKLLRSIQQFFNYLINRRKEKRLARNNQLVHDSVQAFFESDYAQTEKLLSPVLKDSRFPLYSYLLCARSAHHLDLLDKRDDYFRQALQYYPQAEVSIGLLQARCQLEKNQNEQALAHIQQLHDKHRDHTAILSMLASIYNKLEDWSNLNRLTPLLKKHANASFLDMATIQQYTENAVIGLMKSRYADLSALQEYYNSLDPELGQSVKILEPFIQLLIRHKQFSLAETCLRERLDKQWDDSLIKLYSGLNFDINHQTLEIIESWLQENPNNAYLLLALGKACISLSLWGKAQNYLSACIAIDDLPEAYLWMAQLLENNMEHRRWFPGLR